MLKYIQFLLNSTNKHGVHSPFIFKVVTQCFNKKTTLQNKQQLLAYRELFPAFKFSNKKAHLLIRMLNYFKPKNVLLVSTNEIENTIIQIGNEKSSISFLDNIVDTSTYDLIYFGKKQKETLSNFKTCLKYVHNDSVLILNDIHSNTKMLSIWKTIKQHPKIKVSIDTFYFGIVFFRREQEKEHFIIRL